MGKRQFKSEPAKRERVPMLVGLVGPSGGGKTYSALRLATGMQTITGGKIFVVDTEARRALHYADDFDFQHVQMDEPFSPQDYLGVLRFCKEEGASIIIVDSMSHEHEGPGGVLEMHDAELDKLAGNDWARRNKMTFSAWAKPKAQRRKLVSEILRMGINAIFCFRAKEKLKIITGKDPVHLGWQPVGGDDYVYEMMVNVLLYPHSGGVPNWSPDEKAEKSMTKLPGYLKGCFPNGKPISEETGKKIAEWAQGEGVNEDLESAITLIAMSRDPLTLKLTLGELAKSLVPTLTPREKEKLRDSARDRRKAWKDEEPGHSDQGKNGAGTGDPAASTKLAGRDGSGPTAGKPPVGEEGGEESAASPPDEEVDPDTGEVIPPEAGVNLS